MMTKLNRFKVIFDLFPCFFVVVVIIAFVVGSLVGPDNVRHHFPLFWVLFFFLSSSFPTAIVALSFICFLWPQVDFQWNDPITAPGRASVFLIHMHFLSYQSLLFPFFFTLCLFVLIFPVFVFFITFFSLLISCYS